MLQRIQTVFLILAALFMAGSLLFPIWLSQSPDSDTAYRLFSFYFEQTQQVNGEAVIAKTYMPYTLISIFAIVSVIVAIVEITKFKNRLLQMKLSALNSLFMAATLGFSAYYATNLFKEYGGGYALGLFLPAVAMILNMLANRYIRKDERLVKSVDRIR